MRSSTLSMLALALTLAQNFVAAAPGYHPSNNSSMSWGTAPTHPLPTTMFTTVVTKTKTLTWTLYIPCTTTALGTTSYYSTASVYTTCVSEYETVTLSQRGPLSSVYSIPVVTLPVVVASTTVALLPVTCPPATTVTVTAAPQTVTVTAPHVYRYKTKTITITAAAAAAATTGGTAEHGMCRPGTQCYSHIHGHDSWNSTAAVSTRYYATAVGTGR